MGDNSATAVNTTMAVLLACAKREGIRGLMRFSGEREMFCIGKVLALRYSRRITETMERWSCLWSLRCRFEATA